MATVESTVFGSVKAKTVISATSVEASAQAMEVVAAARWTVVIRKLSVERGSALLMAAVGGVRSKNATNWTVVAGSV